MVVRVVDVYSAQWMLILPLCGKECVHDTSFADASVIVEDSHPARCGGGCQSALTLGP